MNEKIRWGIIGAGGIGRRFAKGLAQSKTGILTAVASRNAATAQAFAGEFPGVTSYASGEDLLADVKVDAVYIASPHPSHLEWIVRAADAGKAILCEKPLTLNHADASLAVEAAQRAGVFLMEAFMYRCQPQTRRLVELVRDGAIGEVQLIDANFSFAAGFDPESRIWNNALGGGGILDVGCYTLSMARLIAGASVGRAFLDPDVVEGVMLPAKTGVDEIALAILKFPNRILAQLRTGVGLAADNDVTIYGTKGSLRVPDPWFASGKIEWKRRGEDSVETIDTGTGEDIYAVEADHVAEHLAAGESPWMSLTDTLGNLRAMDAWRADCQFVYDSEKPTAPALSRPATGRPLVYRRHPEIPVGQIDGVEKPISRLILGCDNQRTQPDMNAIADDFFERGGNAFDTAYIYGGGLQERLLGRWIETRGVREEVVVIAKGGHTPYCLPEFIEPQLMETLGRLRTDYADIYMLHRDNPEVPAGEFAFVLHDLKRRGLIRAFGGSNWSPERVDAANASAEAMGDRFSVLSNNLSLARMVDPVWAGCVSSSDPTSRAWLKKTQTALLAWSSQARGFFTGRAHPEDLSDHELVRCWYSPDNFVRLEKARKLAADRGVLPVQIALAWVLSQDFPTFALIGPRQIAETRSSVQGVGLVLSPEEREWLATGE